MNKYLISKVLLMLFFIGLTLNANAVTVTCTDVVAPTTLSLVQYASACERSLTADQDNVTATVVNTEEFFGPADWVYLDKDDPAGNGQTGVWSMDSNYWLTYASIMLIFKDGSNTTLVGFLLTPTFTSGTWNSPFTVGEFGVGLCGYDGNGQPKDPECDKIKAVSHVSYYGRGTPSGEEPPPPTVVSEPSALLLMLFGFASLVFARRQQV